MFEDDLSDPNSGFGVGTSSGGTVAYVDGALQFDTSRQGAWIQSRRTLPLSWPVLHVEADMTPSANGSVGLLCADNDDELWGAVASNAGIGAFVSLASGGVNILTTHEDPGWTIPPTTTTRVALDCAGAETGAFRMQLSLPDVGLAATYEVPEGPDSFDRVGIYAESAVHPFQLRVDKLAAYGGDGLLLRVPAAWRAGCIETAPSTSDTGAQASLSCPLTTGRSNVVDYVLFDTKESMDAAYQARVENGAVERTGSCDSGTHEGEYTIAGLPSGRILCGPEISGIRFDWTHDELLILSTLTDSDGSYPDTYADWLIAGPE